MWFDCVLDFRFLVSVHACTLVLATCVMMSGNLYLAMVSCVVLINQFTWFNLGILLRCMVLFLHSSFHSMLYFPASSPSMLPFPA